MSKGSPPDDFLAFLEAQRSAFRAELPGKLHVLEALWANARASPGDSLEDLERAAHSLAGSAGTFGFAGIGACAMSLEQAVKRLASSGDAIHAVEDAFAELRAAFGEIAVAGATRRRQSLKRILYVEDEADIRTVARMALQQVGGFEVIECASGAEAIEAAPGANADLILLDVMMPGMDGPSILAALRALPATAATPVVFMTAKVQPAEIAHYRELGALDVIAKPFDPMQVSEEIQGIWNRRQA